MSGQRWSKHLQSRFVVVNEEDTGKFCAPIEAKPCLWSGRTCHPDDIRVCELSGLPIHFEFAANDGPARLSPLVDLLNGFKRTADEPQLWNEVTTKIATVLGNTRCRIESAALSPDRQQIAVCCELRTLLGLRVHQTGLVYSIAEHTVIGRAARGRRTSAGWSEAKG